MALASHISENSTTEDLTTLDSANASAYRWNAIADFYDYYNVSDAVVTGDLTALSAEDVSAFRWNALAKYYSNAK